MGNKKQLIDFEAARGKVMDILGGKVTTPVAVKVAIAMQEAAVDVVEVVRCKDCKHLMYSAIYKKYFCSNICGLRNICTPNNDFCSYGERKDNV